MCTDQFYLGNAAHELIVMQIVFCMKLCSSEVFLRDQCAADHYLTKNDSCNSSNPCGSERDILIFSLEEMRVKINAAKQAHIVIEFSSQ